MFDKLNHPNEYFYILSPVSEPPPGPPLAPSGPSAAIVARTPGDSGEVWTKPNLLIQKLCYPLLHLLQVAMAPLRGGLQLLHHRLLLLRRQLNELTVPV